MKNPFDFFDAIYCINLDERTDRWEHSLKQFEILEISNKVQRFSAIKPTKDKDSKWNRPTPWKNRWRYPLLGAVGCAESHKSIIKIAKEKNYKNVMVFEDDFYVMENWKEHLKNGISQLKNFHILYLGYTLFQATDLIHTIGPNLSKCESNRKRGIHRTLALAYNHTIYDTLIKNIDSFNWKTFGRQGHVDKYYARTRQIQKYFISPPIVKPDLSFESDIS
jgi:GR25 family glycosyltransferase involved in LPS biosynthesis